MTKKFLIVIDGPMGSGKTTTTKILNQKLPDTARIALPDIKRLIPNYKESPGELSVVREVMKTMCDTYLKLGISVIVECVSKAEGMRMFETVARAHGANFYSYRLTAPKDVRWERVLERTLIMMDTNMIPEFKVVELQSYFEPNHKFYLENIIDFSTIIETDISSSEEVAEMIYKKLPL